MARVRTLKPRAKPASARLKPQRMAERREIVGRSLQKLRFEMWKTEPHCEHCGKLTPYPYGFEIDHIIPLDQGGEDSQSNRQLLCLDCHRVKTLTERNERGGMF